MEGYNLLYILIFLILSAFIFLFLKENNYNHKSPAIKKEELIKSYEDNMLELINKYKDDKIQLQRKKIEYLKISSNELHNNIFFDADEAKAIIQNLASL